MKKMVENLVYEVRSEKNRANISAVANNTKKEIQASAEKSIKKAKGIFLEERQSL